MTQLNETYKKENKFEFIADFSSFAFGAGYSYTKIEGYRNLIHLTFMFWHLDFAWCWHRWGEPKNIVHKSVDGEIVEVMPWSVRKCKTCGKKNYWKTTKI